MQFMQCCRYNNLLAQTRPHQYGNGISVLLVDYDKPCHCRRRHQGLLSLVATLKLYSYKVTVDPCASQALSRLEKGKETFHLVMVNFDSYDGQSFKLLRAAVNFGLPTLLMTDHEDYGGALARTALEEGAFLCLEKPILGCTVKNLWQHVLRESKTRRGMGVQKEMIVRDHVNSNGLVVDNGSGTTVNDGFNQLFSNYVIENHNPERNQDIAYLNNNQFHVTSDDNVGDDRTIWTEELHNTFMDAVHKLGEGRCFPKDILETMNVPNLTRMQVASHLQKVRNKDWQGPNKKMKPSNPSDSQGDNKRIPSRFGIMPEMEKDDTEKANLDVDDFLVDDLSQSPFYNEKI